MQYKKDVNLWVLSLTEFKKKVRSKQFIELCLEVYYIQKIIVTSSNSLYSNTESGEFSGSKANNLRVSMRLHLAENFSLQFVC